MVQGIGSVGGGGWGNVGGLDEDGGGTQGFDVMNAAQGIMDEIRQQGGPPAPGELQDMVGGVAEQSGVDPKQLMEFVLGAIQSEAPESARPGGAGGPPPGGMPGGMGAFGTGIAEAAAAGRFS
jgi:hypothetical protein